MEIKACFFPAMFTDRLNSMTSWWFIDHRVRVSDHKGPDRTQTGSLSRNTASADEVDIFYYSKAKQWTLIHTRGKAA